MTAGSDDKFDDDSEAEIAHLPPNDLHNHSITDADHAPCPHALETPESTEKSEHVCNETDLLHTDPDRISTAKTQARDPSNWTTTLTPLTINSFQSPVGRAVCSNPRVTCSHKI